MSSIDIGKVTNDFLKKEEAKKAKAKVHYLRFDPNTKIELASGEAITAFEGWDEVSQFLKATEPKDMLKRLIALAMLANQGKIIILTQEQVPTTKKRT